MSIGIKGQYSLKFSVTNHPSLSDFIVEEDLVSFKLIEEAGNILPIYELIFYTSDESLFPVFHEGNDLEATIGVDEEVMTAKLTVTKTQSTRNGKEKRLIILRGLYSAMPYISNSKIFLSAKKSAVEVMIDRAKAVFGKTNILTNVDSSFDKQVWIQPNSSDKKFINELWLHAWFPDSFPAVGICSDGKFVIKDIMKDIQAGDSTLMWKFVDDAGSGGDKEISYEGLPDVETNTGFINNWLGYGKELKVHELDTSFDYHVLEEVTPIVALSSKMAKRIEIDKRFAAAGIINENMHENYHRAYMKNISHLAAFQNVKVTLTFNNLFKPIRILDKVSFKEGGTSGDGSSEFSSGIYYVSKVARVISHRQLSTTVVLNRESLNAIKATA